LIRFDYIKDFWKSREGRIGASDIAKMIPNPEKPFESLAGYGHTAVTLYEEKIGLRLPDPYTIPALIGNRTEPTILEIFIKNFFGIKKAAKFYYSYMLCEVERLTRKNLDCAQFNTGTEFKHHTEVMNDFAVAHADCVYIPYPSAQIPQSKVKHDGITIDISKPFGIEAKSSRLWGAAKNYDLDAKGWQGIPWKNYFQIQFQMALYGFEIAYLPLLYNMSEYKVYKVKANKKYMARMMELAHDMKRCIDKEQPPKHLAMNAYDIRKLYPEVKDDFREVSGKELNYAKELSERHIKAKEQIEIWKIELEDVKNSFGILLKDTKQIKGLINDELQTIAAWRKAGGGESISVSELKKLKPRTYNNLKKEGLIKEKESTMYPDVRLREF